MKILGGSGPPRPPVGCAYGRKGVLATAFKTDLCSFRNVNISSSGEVVTSVVTVESDFSFGGVLYWCIGH